MTPALQSVSGFELGTKIPVTFCDLLFDSSYRCQCHGDCGIALHYTMDCSVFAKGVVNLTGPCNEICNNYMQGTQIAYNAS